MSASSSRLVVGLLFVIGTAACTYLTPYKIDIQQGNVVTPEAIEKLKVGMTRSQVGFILGTPLLADVFHGNRWDYVYYLRKGGRVGEERKVRLLFEDSKLKQIDGDVVAAKAKDDKPIGAAKAKNAASSETEKAQDAKPSEAMKAKDAEPSEAAKAKNAEASEATKARDVAPGDAAKAQGAAPSAAERAQDVAPRDAASANDAAPSDAAKANNAEPGEPAPALNETKQP
jgi:outer membrane protein assembly factor BamE